MPVRSRVPCQSTKKNVLFFWIGPPTVKPVLIAAKLRLRPRLRKIVARVQIFIAKEFEDVP